MPTMSSLRSKPSLTPCTMLATSARARPCSARTCRSSLERSMTIVPSATRVVRPLGTGWVSLPLGPSARTLAPSTWTFTPCGIGMGSLPMRDIWIPLPHVGEDFAADLLLAGLAIGEHAAGGGEQRHAHPGQDRGDLVVGHVHPPARRGDAHQSGDHLLVGRAVLEVDAQRTLLGVLQHPVVLDEPLVLQELGDAHLELRRRDVHLLVLGVAGVADAGEQIGDRIASHGLPARFHDAGHLTLEGQLTEAQATHLELAEIAAGPTAQLAPVIAPRAELGRRLRLHDERGLGHGSCHSLNGMPRPARSARASSSVGAVVTMMMSMPRTLSTLS